MGGMTVHLLHHHMCHCLLSVPLFGARSRILRAVFEVTAFSALLFFLYVPASLVLPSTTAVHSATHALPFVLYTTLFLRNTRVFKFGFFPIEANEEIWSHLH